MTYFQIYRSYNYAKHQLNNLYILYKKTTIQRLFFVELVLLSAVCIVFHVVFCWTSNLYMRAITPRYKLFVSFIAKCFFETNEVFFSWNFVCLFFFKDFNTSPKKPWFVYFKNSLDQILHFIKIYGPFPRQFSFLYVRLIFTEELISAFLFLAH